MKRHTGMQFISGMMILLPLFAMTLFTSCSCNTFPFDTLPDLIDIDRSMKAFPGAEGHGAWSRGGRGGEVIYVTNLADSGAGSFREAVSAAGKRTVVFAVSGVITLNSLVIIENPYITIAGQTAPGNGITLVHSGIYARTHDVIIRHIRIRPGDSAQGHSYEDRDCLTIGENAWNVIADHISVSWSIDELVSTWYAPQYITIQWSILSEALSESRHPEGEHSKALLVGDNTQKISIHHNIFAHVNDRIPAQVMGGSSCDIVSNIIYDWGEYGFSFAMDAVRTAVKINLLNNHFKTGPSTLGNFFNASSGNAYNSQIYLGGISGDCPLVVDYNANPESFYQSYAYLSRTPVEWDDTIATGPIADEYDTIISGAGATLPARDGIDIRIASEIGNTSGTIIDSQSDVGGYPAWTPVIWTTAELDAFDQDRDGMADSWETGNGLDPANPADRNLTGGSEGYTNLERYLNSL